MTSMSTITLTHRGTMTRRQRRAHQRSHHCYLAHQAKGGPQESGVPQGIMGRGALLGQMVTGDHLDQRDRGACPAYLEHKDNRDLKVCC